ncbi:expressed unknown protein [Seminavis robusta]|uniref:Uncharacterized protein n=1 Tax=Seminavis robusta TaxID=568900 RepID=A0A9N8EJE3_9STRA|nr:expressed unknown protein [Seminavis robusta]|eukprot:Sro1053_g235821.1  (97) ;mRNA; r:7104-7394
MKTAGAKGKGDGFVEKHNKAEDSILARAFRKTTTNLVKGAKEKGDVFWGNLCLNYNAIRQEEDPQLTARNQKSCQNRWSRHMLPCMNHFIGCWRFA